MFINYAKTARKILLSLRMFLAYSFEPLKFLYTEQKREFYKTRVEIRVETETHLP